MFFVLTNRKEIYLQMSQKIYKLPGELSSGLSGFIAILLSDFLLFSDMNFTINLLSLKIFWNSSHILIKNM